MSNTQQEKELKLLITKRENLFKKVQILFDLIKGIKSDKSKIPAFKARYKELSAISECYHEICDQINMAELNLNPDYKMSSKAMESFDLLYYEIIAFADEHLPTSVAPTAIASTSDSVTDSKPVQPRLPKIELPTFDGSIKKWTSFYDQFRSLIHDNKRIANVEKFHYLLSCVSGSAVSVVRSLPLSEQNYSVVWDSLVKKYHNKRVIGSDLLDTLFNYTSSSRESAATLNSFLEIFSDSVTALKAIDIPDLSDFIILQLGLRSLPPDTRKNFELKHLNSEIPTFNQLINFIQDQSKVLEVTTPPENRYKTFNKPPTTEKQLNSKSTFSNRKSVISLTSSPSTQIADTCPICKMPHSIYKCLMFDKLTPFERKNKIQQLRYCFNCLRGSHMLRSCTSKTQCLLCGHRHHTKLCGGFSESTSNPSYYNSKQQFAKTQPTSSFPTSSSKITSDNHSSETSNVNCNISSRKLSSLSNIEPSYTVLLGTALIHIKNSCGEYTAVRALIDSGAQTSFITSSCAHKLGLPIRKFNTPVAGLGLNIVPETKGVISCILKPLQASEPFFKTEAIILSNITNPMPSIRLPENVIKNYVHLFLADPKFNTPGPIDFLIGADLYPFIVDGKKTEMEPGLPCALHSVFGWIIIGPFNPQSITTNCITSLFSSNLPPLNDEIIKQFWSVEEPPQSYHLNPADTQAEEIFKDNTLRDPNGRYVVPILLKTNLSTFSCSDSYSLALSRLTSLERRLNKNPELKREYQQFLDEYASLGHMSKVPHVSKNPNCYIIPHHAVFKNSTSTKLRVVFDGSSLPGGHPSLNSSLLTGPKLQHDIVDIILRFRLHKIIFVADICKMYRQILIRNCDRRYQHIIWRKNSNSPIEEFELNTVTYGLASSAYLALRSLLQLKQDEGHHFPLAAEIISRDIYIDDVLSGCDSIEKTQQTIKELKSLLKLGGFELKKWSSNSPDILDSIPEDFRETPLTFDTDGSGIIKVLGLKFNPKYDFFSYQTCLPNSTCTKRQILSYIARIYDPLGWLCPVTFRVKCLIQHLWRAGLDWDDEVPTYIFYEWTLFCEQIQSLSEFKLHRFILLPNFTSLALVGFSDASERGYCGVVYLHVTSHCGDVKTSLLIAKSKVSPLKPLTIPRLELCGTLLLAKLLKHVFNIYSPLISISQVYAFTDSTTVISWLKTPPHLLKTFVSSRVVQILDLIAPSSWHHVKSEDNPADCASRGLTPKEFVEHPLWFHGPPWLSSSIENWPNFSFSYSQDNLPELKNISSINSFVQSVSINTSSNWIPLLQYSSFTKLQRVTAWCLRYCFNCRVKRDNCTAGPLTCDELNLALSLIIKAVQVEVFQSEYQAIASKRVTTSSLQRLCPFVDPAGCLRVGGRLINAPLLNNSLHPLILPKIHHITNLIIDYYHVTHLHVGPRTLQSILCRKFWIISARDIIRSRLSKCLVCYKLKPPHASPLMGNLPPCRVTPSRPFTNTGIDFGGPFLIKEGNRRNSKVSKCYLSLFVCMATKAVHLELVSDLSTHSFLAALDRFVSRRGLCSNIFTDCGTNFVGSKNYLSNIYQFLKTSNSEISDELSKRSIKWWLHPPSSPHFGGLYEAGIRSAKYHLKRVLGDQSLNFEELTTLFCRIEAIMNSRPLCSLSPDPSELDVLTPGHFLIGGPLVSVPEVNLLDEKSNRLTRWRLLTQSAQHFWKKWSREYLHTLQQRNKWFTPHQNLKEGDLVLLVEDRLPPLQWRTGRVEKIHPGSDGVVRVALVKTSHGSFLRPAIKLCPLPCQ